MVVSGRSRYLSSLSCSGNKTDVTRGALFVLAVASSSAATDSYQFDPSLVEALGSYHDEPRLIRILAFAAMSAARRLADHAGQHLNVPSADVGLQLAIK